MDRITDIVMPIALLLGGIAILLFALEMLWMLVTGALVCH